MAGVTFDVSFRKMVQDLQEVTSSVERVGKGLDTLNKDATAMAKNMGNEIGKTSRTYIRLAEAAESSSEASERTAKILDSLRYSAEAAFTGIVLANQKATIAAKAYHDANSASGQIQSDTDNKSREVAHLKAIAGEYHAAELSLKGYVSQAGRLNDSRIKGANSAKLLFDAEKQVSTASTKTTAELIKQNSAYQQAASTTGQELAQKKVLTDTLNTLSTAQVKVSSTLALQNQESKIAASADARAVANNKILLTALNQVNTAEAKQVATLMGLRKEIELFNSETGKQARAAQAAIVQLKEGEKAQQADVQVKNQRSAATAKLRSELEYLRTAEGRNHVMLQQQLREEKKALTSSSEAHLRKNKKVKIGNQLTAAMRASLQGLQASIGMYTSSTILAATSTYALVRALRGMVVTGAEFQATMTRTQAIMGNSVPVEMQGKAFTALEGQIRAMGRTSQFTASEVAQSVTELGQAGLSAGQAMTALRPTLDLAVIGQLDTARAADHATNIMMIFGKEARDLTGIVDVMAAAVTSSNTNVDQLANALTYAGPAADTLGLSLQTTAASISVLANAGFKASRAGTALRRLFVSLANPTKKGKAVLDQFNVSVTDLEGNTKDLTNIIGQLSAGMGELADTEKLAAIQDLVGVYASSPIAALIKQSEALETMDLILRRAGGSATEMRNKIEAALKFDFRTALSAFEDAQLQVFDKFGDRMQYLTLQVAEWLSSLSIPIDLDGLDSPITKLDVLMDRVERLVVLAGFFSLAWGAKKVWSPLNGSIATTGKSLKDFSRRTVVATTAVRAFAGGSLHASNALNVAATAATRLGRAISAIPIINIALGLYTAYTAFDLFFSDNNIDRIKGQEKAVLGYAESYLQVKRNLELASAAEAKAAARAQFQVMEESAKMIRGRIKEWEDHRKTLEAMEMPIGLADEEIKLYKLQLKDIYDTMRDLKSQVLAPVEEGSLSNLDQVDKVLKEISSTQADILRRKATGFMDWFKDESYLASLKSVKEYESILDGLYVKLRKLTQGQSDAAKSDTLLLGQSAKAIKANAREYTALGIEMNKTDFEKHIDLEYALIEAKKEHLGLATAIEYGAASDKQKQRFEKLTQLIMEQAQQVHLSKLELDDYEKSAEDWVAKIALIKETETEKNERLKKELKEIISLREFEQAIAGGSDTTAALEGAKALADLLEKEFNIRTELHALENRSSRTGSGGVDKEAQKLKQLIERAMSTFEALEGKFDAAGLAARKFEEDMKSLALLLAEDEITTQEYASAIRQLKVDFNALTLSQDENYQTIKRLQEAYLNSPMQQHRKDLVALEKAYEGTNKKSLEYLRIRERMMDQIREEARGSSPTVRAPEVTGPFSDFISTAMGQAEDRKAFSKNEESWERGYGDDLNTIFNEEQAELARVAKEFAHEQEQEKSQAHQEALSQIERDGLLNRQAAFDQFNTGRKEMTDNMVLYEEQSKKMLFASMAGSMSGMMGMLADAAEEGTTAQKVAFVAQKTLAIAQVLLQTHVAVANANATAPGGISPLAPWIQAQGYMSAGLMAALSIGELGGSKTRGGSDYAGAYDKGGYIPTGKYGIVGEYGPEIVNGPSHVTGREDTARRLSGGSQTVNISPEINIEYNSEGSSSPEQSREDAAMLGNTIKMVVIDTIHDQLRPNGALYRRQ